MIPKSTFSPGTLAHGAKNTIMKNYYYIFFLMLLVAFTRCQNGSGDIQTSSIDSAATQVDAYINEENSVPSEMQDNDETVDSITHIKFNELSLSIYKFNAWNEDKRLSAIQNDTAYIICELGESILGQKIKIESSQLSDLKIEQAYETSISISYEGPHCDLIDWKHFRSDWLEVKSVSQDVYQVINYSDADKEKFPKINVEELKQHVKDYCGEEWYELVKKTSKATEYPIGVGISRVFIRLTGNFNGRQVIKLLILEEAMGC